MLLDLWREELCDRSELHAASRLDGLDGGGVCALELGPGVEAEVPWRNRPEWPDASLECGCDCMRRYDEGDLARLSVRGSGGGSFLVEGPAGARER